jgi:hypothetical protein
MNTAKADIEGRASVTEPTVAPETNPAAEVGSTGSVGGRSEALGRNITRLQKEEAERLKREAQERWAKLREKARLD